MRYLPMEGRNGWNLNRRAGLYARLGIRALAGFDGGNDRCPFSPPIPGKVIFRRMGKTTLGGLKKEKGAGSGPFSRSRSSRNVGVRVVPRWRKRVSPMKTMPLTFPRLSLLIPVTAWISGILPSSLPLPCKTILPPLSHRNTFRREDDRFFPRGN